MDGRTVDGWRPMSAATVDGLACMSLSAAVRRICRAGLADGYADAVDRYRDRLDFVRCNMVTFSSVYAVLDVAACADCGPDLCERHYAEAGWL